MKLFYYTIDDLRLGFDPEEKYGWRLSRFLDWTDALEHYHSLPERAVKVLGAGNGDLQVDMVRRLDVGAGPENALVLDFFALPLWRKDEGVICLVRELVSELDIRWCLDVDKLVPAPEGDPASQRLDGKYLWPGIPGDSESAVRWLYVPGTGWVVPAELKRRYPTPEQASRYPVVTRYRADGITAGGAFVPLDISHWEYKLLAHRTKERFDHKKH